MIVCEYGIKGYAGSVTLIFSLEESDEIYVPDNDRSASVKIREYHNQLSSYRFSGQFSVESIHSSGCALDSLNI